MLENVGLAKYSVPTPVQVSSMYAPLISEIRNANHHIWGRHACLCPNRSHLTHLKLISGSGKTAAFLVPVLSKLFGKALKLKAPRAKPGAERGYQAQPLVLVLGPTRELVWQIFDEARKFCYRSMLRPWYPLNFKF